jgi:hypothetical protein
MLTTQLRRVYNRSLREAAKVSFLKRRSDTFYQALLEQFSQQLAPLDSTAQTIVAALNTEGIFITNLSDFKLPLTAELLAGINGLLPELKETPCPIEREFLIEVPNDRLLQYPAIFQWGLNDRLLNIVENYLQLSVAYHGVYFRRDLNNNVVARSRQWHLDKEDRRMLKVIIYLHDVDERGGPLQYIHSDWTSVIAQSIHYDYGRVTDSMMEQVIPASQWISCVGKAGTVILFDPARMFHRGKLPVSSDRFTLFFDYTSRYPERPYYCKSCFSVQEMATVLHHTSERQKQCVLWNNKLWKKYHQ